VADAKHPTALISYSHDSTEHERRVLELCNRLRSRGVDTLVDQFLPGAPSEGWPLWMERQIESRDFTMMVCTEAYRRRFMEEEAAGVGRGVVWEARILRNLLYEDSDRHRRIVPLIFGLDARPFVPTVFKGHFYDVSDDVGFEGLLRHLLREPGADAAALGALGPQGSRWSAFEHPWLVPDATRTRYFTGREGLLASLRQRLVEHHRAALSGLGGVGKTQAAIEYAVRYRADYPAGVFWTTAESPSGLTGGFVEIAKALSLNAAVTSDHDRIVRAVIDWFDTDSGWLLIFDNVDDRRIVLPFVPQRGEGDVLITSRESVFQELGIARALEVVDLDRDEGVRFLLTRTGRDEGERDAASALAEELGDLPLALEQAAAYVVETDASFGDYLAAFRKRRIGVLEKASGLVSRDTVAVTWAENFEKVERASPAAAHVLRVAAFLAPDAIPFEIFSKGAGTIGGAIAAALADPDDSLAMNELLRPLTRYSLIRHDARARAFDVHRLVQEIVRSGMDKVERARSLDTAARAVNAAFPSLDYATWAQSDRLISHSFAIAGHLEGEEVRLLAGAAVLLKAGLYLNRRGRYAEAKDLEERALAIRERELGSDHPDVAECLNALGDVYDNFGDYARSAAVRERSLSIRERALGPDHRDTAMSLHGLAASYVYQARYVEAQTLYERSVDVFERAVGPDSPNLATALSNLANVHVYQARYADALPLYERALSIMERAFGSEAPDVAFGVYGLADVHYCLGHLDESKRYNERALSIWERSFGPDHQYVSFPVEALGNIHARRGESDVAEPLFKRAIAIRERALGPDHPQVAIPLTTIADFYRDQGRYDDARANYERAIAIRERALGAEHSLLAASLAGLAAMDERQGRTADAIALYERALKIRERALVAGHPDIVEVRGALDALRAKASDSGA